MRKGNYTYNKKRQSNNKKIKQDEKLEATTRIRIDRNRLDDTKTLDTSFLEGRMDTKNVKAVKRQKEKISCWKYLTLFY